MAHVGKKLALEPGGFAGGFQGEGEGGVVFLKLEREGIEPLLGFVAFGEVDQAGAQSLDCATGIKDGGLMHFDAQQPAIFALVMAFERRQGTGALQLGAHGGARFLAVLAAPQTPRRGSR